MNWKHGGSMSDKNDIKYTIEPTQTRSPPPSSPQGTCKAKAQVLFHYTWEVSGGGWKDGDTKAALRKKMGECGLMTKWKFDYYDEPQSDGTEWHASGTLPWAIADHCVAWAVEAAGGFPSKC
jgi:hypothetical protein